MAGPYEICQYGIHYIGGMYHEPEKPKVIIICKHGPVEVSHAVVGATKEGQIRYEGRKVGAGIEGRREVQTESVAGAFIYTPLA